MGAFAFQNRIVARYRNDDLRQYSHRHRIRIAHNTTTRATCRQYQAIRTRGRVENSSLGHLYRQMCRRCCCSRSPCTPHSRSIAMASPLHIVKSLPAVAVSLFSLGFAQYGVDRIAQRKVSFSISTCAV